MTLNAVSPRNQQFFVSNSQPSLADNQKQTPDTPIQQPGVSVALNEAKSTNSFRSNVTKNRLPSFPAIEQLHQSPVRVIYCTTFLSGIGLTHGQQMGPFCRARWFSDTLPQKPTSVRQSSTHDSLQQRTTTRNTSRNQRPIDQACRTTRSSLRGFCQSYCDVLVE